jgi:hypothetical protein
MVTHHGQEHSAFGGVAVIACVAFELALERCSRVGSALRVRKTHTVCVTSGVERGAKLCSIFRVLRASRSPRLDL